MWNFKNSLSHSSLHSCVIQILGKLTHFFPSVWAIVFWLGIQLLMFPYSSLFLQLLHTFWNYIVNWIWAYASGYSVFSPVFIVPFCSFWWFWLKLFLCHIKAGFLLVQTGMRFFPPSYYFQSFSTFSSLPIEENMMLNAIFKKILRISYLKYLW